jgi:hypothetical protein
MVSIHCPPGYEPGALPLRHSAVDKDPPAFKTIYYNNCRDLTIHRLQHTWPPATQVTLARSPLPSFEQ